MKAYLGALCIWVFVSVLACTKKDGSQFTIEKPDSKARTAHHFEESEIPPKDPPLEESVPSDNAKDTEWVSILDLPLDLGEPESAENTENGEPATGEQSMTPPGNQPMVDVVSDGGAPSESNDEKTVPPENEQLTAATSGGGGGGGSRDAAVPEEDGETGFFSGHYYCSPKVDPRHESSPEKCSDLDGEECSIVGFAGPCGDFIGYGLPPVSQLSQEVREQLTAARPRRSYTLDGRLIENNQFPPSLPSSTDATNTLPTIVGPFGESYPAPEVLYVQLNDMAEMARVAGTKVDLRLLRAHRALLPGVPLKYANLTGAELNDAVLSDADLSQSELIDVSAQRTQFSGINGQGLVIRGREKLRRNQTNNVIAWANIEDAIFTRANLENAQFINVYARNTEFNGARLVRAIFEESDFRESSFAHVNGQFARFSQVILKQVDFSFAYFSSVYRHAQKRNEDEVTRFDGLGEDAQFGNPSGNRKYYEGGLLDRTIWRGANLCGVNFSGSILPENAEMHTAVWDAQMPTWTAFCQLLTSDSTTTKLLPQLYTVAGGTLRTDNSNENTRALAAWRLRGMLYATQNSPCAGYAPPNLNEPQSNQNDGIEFKRIYTQWEINQIWKNSSLIYAAGKPDSSSNVYKIYLIQIGEKWALYYQDTIDRVEERRRHRETLRERRRVLEGRLRDNGMNSKVFGHPLSPVALRDILSALEQIETEEEALNFEIVPSDTSNKLPTPNNSLTGEERERTPNTYLGYRFGEYVQTGNVSELWQKYIEGPEAERGFQRDLLILQLVGSFVPFYGTVNSIYNEGLSFNSAENLILDLAAVASWGAGRAFSVGGQTFRLAAPTTHRVERVTALIRNTAVAFHLPQQIGNLLGRNFDNGVEVAAAAIEIFQISRMGVRGFLRVASLGRPNIATVQRNIGRVQNARRTFTPENIRQNIANCYLPIEAKWRSPQGPMDWFIPNAFASRPAGMTPNDCRTVRKAIRRLLNARNPLCHQDDGRIRQLEGFVRHHRLYRARDAAKIDGNKIHVVVSTRDGSINQHLPERHQSNAIVFATDRENRNRIVQIGLYDQNGHFLAHIDPRIHSIQLNGQSYNLASGHIHVRARNTQSGTPTSVQSAHGAGNPHYSIGANPYFDEPMLNHLLSRVRQTSGNGSLQYQVPIGNANARLNEINAQANRWLATWQRSNLSRSSTPIVNSTLNGLSAGTRGPGGVPLTPQRFAEITQWGTVDRSGRLVVTDARAAQNRTAQLNTLMQGYQRGEAAAMREAQQFFERLNRHGISPEVTSRWERAYRFVSEQGRGATTAPARGEYMETITRFLLMFE